MPEPTTPPTVRLAVLISGGGTTLRNLLERIVEQRLRAEVTAVISSHTAAGGLQYAHNANIPSFVEPRRPGQTPEEFSRAVFERCREARADLVVMGGFLKHVLIPADFTDRVINIHPSLIPAFCGRGFYGLRVHQAVLQYGTKVSGCTVHFVDNEYDHGPIILQRVVPVEDSDTAQTLAARVFAAECEAYPLAIEWYAAGRLRRVGRRVFVAPA
jgi:phosphoribosylglycinamide formyltransferase-1